MFPMTGPARMPKSDWDGQILLEQSVFLLFAVSGGYSVIDDTVIGKQYSEMSYQVAVGIFLLSRSHPPSGDAARTIRVLYGTMPPMNLSGNVAGTQSVPAALPRREWE